MKRLSPSYPPAVNHENNERKKLCHKNNSKLHSILKCECIKPSFILADPIAIAVDYFTDNIYIADQFLRGVYVMNGQAEYLFMFNAENIARDGLSYCLASISIYNMLVYVKITVITYLSLI